MGIEVLIIVIAIVVIGGVGYSVWQGRQNQSQIDESPPPPPIQNPSNKEIADNPGTVSGGYSGSLQEQIEPERSEMSTSPAPILPSKPPAPDLEQTEQWMEELADEKAKQDEDMTFEHTL